MYCIYMHKNKINNKVYIGQTKNGQLPEKRWQGGKGYKNNQQFYEDICTFGWNQGFEHIILNNNLTLEEANKFGQEYIKTFNSTNPALGYNKALGGGNSLKNSSKEKLYILSPVVKQNDFLGYNDKQGFLRCNNINIEEEKNRYINKYQKLYGEK